MIIWTEFERQQAALAHAGRRQLYQWGIGLAFLATIRPDGGPRVHPVCPVISAAGLHLLIKAGPSSGTCGGTGVTPCTARLAASPPRRRLRDHRPARGEVTDAEAIGVVRGRDCEWGRQGMGRASKERR